MPVHVGFFSVCVCVFTLALMMVGRGSRMPCIFLRAGITNRLHVTTADTGLPGTQKTLSHHTEEKKKKKPDGHQQHTLISETNNSLCHVVPHFVLNMLFRRVFACRLITVPNTSQKTFIFGSITRGLFEHTRGDVRHKYLAEQR